MTQAEKRVNSAALEIHTRGIDELVNLVAAYRGANNGYSDNAAEETGQCLSVGVELPVLKQLAQFDKLLISLR